MGRKARLNAEWRRDAAAPAKPKQNNRRPHCEDRRLQKKSVIWRKLLSGFSVHARAVQPSDFVFHLQLPTLQLSQLKIVRGWMLKRFFEFGFKHPVALFEFSEMRRLGHLTSLLGSA
jgi:hypothetical protein